MLNWNQHDNLLVLQLDHKNAQKFLYEIYVCVWLLHDFNLLILFCNIVSLFLNYLVD
jgi:hypothetical protein